MSAPEPTDNQPTPEQVVYRSIENLLRQGPKLRLDGGLEVHAILYPIGITTAILDDLKASGFLVVGPLPDSNRTYLPEMIWETPFGTEVTLQSSGDVHDADSDLLMDPDEARQMARIYLAAADAAERGES